MLSVDRANSIKQILYRQNSVTVSELSIMFDVSGETIRRDLQKLSTEDTSIIRVHGGACRIAPDYDPPYDFRQATRIDVKKQIAASCFELIEEGDHLFLDSSTSTLYLSKLIAASGYRLTVITNSLGVLNELCSCENIDVIALGGRYSGSSHSFVGSGTLTELAELFAGKAFVSCAGLDMDFGLTHSSEDEAAIRKTMLLNSKLRCVLMDSKKFGLCKTHGIAAMDNVDIIFTNDAPDDDWLDYFAKHGTSLRICD